MAELTIEKSRKGLLQCVDIVRKTVEQAGDGFVARFGSKKKAIQHIFWRSKRLKPLLSNLEAKYDLSPRNFTAPYPTRGNKKALSKAILVIRPEFESENHDRYLHLLELLRLGDLPYKTEGASQHFIDVLNNENLCIKSRIRIVNFFITME